MANKDTAANWKRAGYGLSVVLLIGLIGWIEFTATGGISIAAYYIIPVFVATWFLSRRWGIAVSAVCACIIFFLDTIKTEPGFAVTAKYINDLMLLAYFIALNWLFSLAKKAYYSEYASARTDFLTGAANRRSFVDSLSVEINRSARHKLIFTLAFLDIDGFKAINDRYGHDKGDMVLVDTVNILKKHTRSLDIIGRMGGDEFVILFPETMADQGCAIIRKLDGVYKEAAKRMGYDLSLSAGIITYERPPADTNEVIRKADMLMYEAKKAGKNMIRHETVK